MGHLCGVKNKTRPGRCRIRLVNQAHCAHHRHASISWQPSDSESSSWSPVGWSSHEPSPWRDPTAALLASLLVDGVDQAVADRVAEYLGRSGTRRLQNRRWTAGDCRLLAATARAILDLKQRLHDVTGEVVRGAWRKLLPGTPAFHLALVKQIAAKVPLPPDAKLEAIARALQLMGIFKCMIEGLPFDACACLTMLATDVTQDSTRRYVKELLAETREALDWPQP